MTSQQTHIDFVNTLTEGLNTNILMYEYFYNGGGVATGDMNDDGLIDVYFTSNMGDNKLYLNKGNMSFQDITESSGTSAREGPWKTGVTMVDINGDGKLDLYLCYSGMLPDEKRVNQLFINEGNDEQGLPHFTEQAAKYGLASAAYSNQAYFFDYDRDGDLDALLLNHNPHNLPILNEVSTAQMIKKDNPFMGVRLFRQSNEHFDDVTQKTGISSSELTYGLGIGISDLNNDGWLDFYISNDYSVPDYLYINNQNGTFSDKLKECIGHNSQFSMGNDVADVNNDGLPDIITLDMLPEDNHRQKLLLAPDNYAKFDLNVRSGFYYQYMRNMLQLNNGNETFSEIGQLAGISNTDWSWAALLADYDNDGWKDLFVTNGYLRDYTNLDFIKYMDDYVKTKGRLQREDVLEIISRMPASNVVNYIFHNDNGLNYINKTDDWGMNRFSNSNGAAYADLDNDGDLDIIVNNINQPAFIYRNESSNDPNNNYLQIKLRGSGKNTQGIGAKITISCKGRKQFLEQSLTRGYLSSVSPVLHFGLGKENLVDTLNIVWNGGKQQVLTNIKSNQRIPLSENDASNGNHPVKRSSRFFKEIQSPVKNSITTYTGNDFKRQPLLTKELSFSGPCVTKGDVNEDGLEDLYVSGGNGQAGMLYFQRSNNSFLPVKVSAFEEDKLCAEADAIFFDANGDGHLDLYVASGGYHTFQEKDKILQDRLYINDGKGNFTKSAGSLPEMPVSKSCIAINDVNDDGHPDLFVGGRVVPGRYPETPASYLLVNDGKGNFENQISTLAPELQKLGMITDAVWVDINQDKKNDLVVVGEWLPVSVFINVDGKFLNQTLTYFDKEYSGWWNRIETGDFNNDQKPDLIIGNIGNNTQFKASDKEPLEIIFKDFDDNGSVDPFLTTYVQGKSYPYVTRDEMLDQLSMLRSRFKTYNSYADVTLQDIFKEEDLTAAGHLTVNCLETTFFQSSNGGKLEIKPLPLQAQYAPIHTITVFDFNRDGDNDLLLCGNESKYKLRLGKSDANYGMLLQGNGKGGFQYIDQSKSGFRIRGDVRSVMQINKILLFGICEQPVVAYQIVK
ncbi:MAG TPA: VCBS repeat-containing protein [Cyclobacteriaceae bacterium]|nr:VCBS repeat-containing protein [Cyclobacteriaceae bacterium]